MEGSTIPRGNLPCSGKEDLFFDQRGETNADREIRESRAKMLCSGCIRREDCLVEAIQGHELGGVWGGLNHRERLELGRAIRTSA